ncbi:MAG: hypothetical protein WD178_00290 [Actinomycetota bacterium]
MLAALLLGAAPAVAQAPDPPAAGDTVVPTSRRPPAIAAAAGILIDASDGSILWEKNSRERRAIASTT